MRTSCARIFITILLLITIKNVAVSQETVSYLGIEQGLSNNSVRSIYQDHKGFMWFGTYDGLNRYDGYEFKVFRNNFGDTNSIVGNVVSAITEDKESNMWLGTRKGANVYNRFNGKFSSVYYASKKDGLMHRVDDVIKNLKTDKDNNILIASEISGFLFCKNASLQAIQIPLLEDDGTLTYQFGVQSITIDNTNKVWVFVQGKGLCVFDYKNMQLRKINGGLNTITCMAADGDSIWIGSGSELLNFQTKTNILTKFFSDGNGLLSNDPLVCILMDKEKKLWLGTNGGGIDIWNTITKKMDHMLPGSGKDALASGSAYAIYQDKENRIWIGTLLGGVNIIDPKKERFRTVDHEPENAHSLTGNYVSAFYEASDKSLWVGTDGSGLNVSRNGKDSFFHYKNQKTDLKSLPNNNVTCIQEDVDHNIWVATFWGGVAKLNSATNNFERYKVVNSKTGVENKVIYFLYTDKKKVLWATALRQGNFFGALYFYNKAANKFDVFDEALSDLFVLKEDNAGELWGGNLTQIVKIDRINKKHVFYDIGQPVRAIQADNAGNLWIGTEGGGLVLFDTKQEKITARYTTTQGLCSNSVLSLLSDGNGNLWMGTYNGLSRFDINKKSFKNYYKTDGLQANQFILNAAIKLASGAFAFGGIKGYNIFFPNDIIKRASTPPLLLTDISISGSPVEQNIAYVKSTEGSEIKELSVPYDKAIFSFGFTALEYSSPANISYAYYMEGWDKDWTYNKNDRTATYTHLPDGHYVLRIKCTNPEGVWNPKEIKIAIVVLPPWYKSWWAWMLYIIIACIAAYFYITYKKRQERLRYEVKLAQLETKNERERLGYEVQLAHIETEKERERLEYDAQLVQIETEKERERLEYEVQLAHVETEKERGRLEYEVQLAHLETEKEREVNEKRLSFFTDISHEFRTPLTLIINPIKELLQQTDKQKKDGNQDLGTVYRNARRLKSLVDQLLLFRKAESGADKLRVAKLNFYQLCQEVYLCFVQQAKYKNITYNFIGDNPLLELYVDREKMEIILYNLLSNALKYTPKNGKVELRIVEDEQFVHVLVNDNGFGIPPEIGENLFSKFYRADTKNTRTQAGFGIGLYLVKHFANEHKGEITYESTLGTGTVFSLKLKKGSGHFDASIIGEDVAESPNYLSQLAFEEEVEVNTQQPIEESKQFANMITDKQTVLLVDDDAEIRKYIAQIFKDDYVVYESANGEEGLKMARDNQPDIIISDIKMHGFSGIDLCKAIKQDAALKHIPVILLTGTSSEELKLEGVKGGADDYITKPFDKELLVARVKNLLKTRSNLQQYFYNEITLNPQSFKVSAEYKEFLTNCIEIVEKHFDDPNFNIKVLASEIGMSHSVAYRKIKAISGQSLNGFIRFIRLRKAARLFIDTTFSVNDVATQVGMYDAKHFRENFNKVFGMNPSDYIKKYRKSFAGKFNVDKEAIESNRSNIE